MSQLGAFLCCLGQFQVAFLLRLWAEESLSAIVAEVCSFVLDGPTYGHFLPHVRAGGSGKGVEDVWIEVEDSGQLSRLCASLSSPCWSCRLVSFLNLEVSLFVCILLFGCCACCRCMRSNLSAVDFLCLFTNEACKNWSICGSFWLDLWRNFCREIVLKYRSGLAGVKSMLQALLVCLKP